VQCAVYTAHCTLNGVPPPCGVPSGGKQHCTTLHCTTLHYTALHSMMRAGRRTPGTEGSALGHSVPLALHCTVHTAQCTALHCNTLHNILHCTALCCATAAPPGPAADWGDVGRNMCSSAVQCSAVQCSAVMCCAVLCSAVQCSAGGGAED
jgi:hypothetical protein